MADNKHALILAGFPGGTLPEELKPQLTTEALGLLKERIQLVNNGETDDARALIESHYLAAEILDFLIQAGFAIDGRSLAVESYTIGDRSLNYDRPETTIARMTKAAFELREKGFQLNP